jgi:hypothetical protein
MLAAASDATLTIADPIHEDTISASNRADARRTGECGVSRWFDTVSSEPLALAYKPPTPRHILVIAATRLRPEPNRKQQGKRRSRTLYGVRMNEFFRLLSERQEAKAQVPIGKPRNWLQASHERDPM